MVSFSGKLGKCALGLGVATMAVAAGVYCDYQSYCANGGFVLEYHAIGSHPDWYPGMVIAPEVFEKHLQYMQEQGYKMVTVAELTERLTQDKDVDKYIALSFDDGYKDDYTHTFPLLQKYGAKATFSVINSRIGGKLYARAEQLREMERSGMEIGSHTYSHNKLDEIGREYLDWELGYSKTELEQRLLPQHKTVQTLAYPCGRYDEASMAKLKEFGYKVALTGNELLNTRTWMREHPLEMRRLIVLDDGKDEQAFKKLLARAYLRSYLHDKGINVKFI
jgi:peptidoglycan/xylan/chitin deacetylase (PgdA/CDA1 family)